MCSGYLLLHNKPSENLMACDSVGQGFFVKGHRIAIFSFKGYIWSLSHIILCFVFFFYNPLKMYQAQLSSQAVEKQVAGQILSPGLSLQTSLLKQQCLLIIIMAYGFGS